MIRIITLSIAILFLSYSYGNPAFTFSNVSYKQALKESKAKNKVIMVFFTLPENPYCQKVEAKIFNTKNTSEYNNNFINIKINPEDKKGDKLADKFNISAYPSIVFINSSEKIIHKIVGINANTDMKLVCNKVNSNKGTLMYYQDLYSKNNKSFQNNPDLLLDYINVLYNAGENYSKQVDLYFNILDESQLKNPINVDAIIKYSKNIYSPEFVFFAQNINGIKPLKYNEIDMQMKLEDVFSNQVMDYIKINPKANPEDTLEALFDYLNIEQRELIETRVMLDYYSLDKNDKEKYFDALMRYVPIHLKYLSSEQIADYCTKLLKTDNREFLEQGIMWTEERLDQELNKDLYFAKIQLLVKLDRIDEVHNEVMRSIDMFGANDKEWNQKLSSLNIKEMDNQDIPLKSFK